MVIKVLEGGHCQ